jgi:hypothetical protein
MTPCGSSKKTLWLAGTYHLHLNVKVILQPTVSRLVCHGIRPTSGTRDQFFFSFHRNYDRLCGLVVRVSGYRLRGPGFDSRRYLIFLVAVGLERVPLSLVRINEELLERKVAARV